MKLHEIKSSRRSTVSDFIVKKYDGLDPMDYYVEPFDVKVEYEYEPESYSDHPYGQGTAREIHASEISIISVTLAHDVVFYDETGKKIMRRFQAGKKLKDLPGWDASQMDYFADMAEREVNG